MKRSWRNVVGAARAPSLVATLAASLALAGCGALAPRAAATPRGTVTFAQQPGSPPTYIFPLYDGAESGNNNITYLQPLMWRPLYWFGHPNSTAPTVDYALSMANPPTFSNGGRTVSVTLRHFMWSDGHPVTTRDVEFFVNLLLADKAESVAYAPGDWMDHVVSVRYPSPTRFVMTLNRVYGPAYFLGNILSVITPIPQHAWDKTSTSGSIGNRDLTPSGAVAVYKYLDTQSKLLTTWDTNPLWQVVDGPFRLEAKDGFDASTGLTILDANRKYSGPDRPHIARLEELPFTSEAAELDSVLAGRVDYGYLPFTDLTLKSRLQRTYRIDPWLSWGFTSIGITFANRTYGPVLAQLYFRQAMQHLVNEPLFIKQIFKGYAVPVYGPIPQQPANPYVGRFVKADPLPYNPAAARQLLTAHGWHVVPSGISSCVRPGSGPGECGAGISRGLHLQLRLLYTSGTVAYSQMMQALQTSFSAAGIQLSLQSAPFNEVLTLAYSCQPTTGVGCNIPLGFLASPNWTYVPVYFPADPDLIQSSTLIYKGNPPFIANILHLIQVADQTGSPAAVYAYDHYMATELPWLSLPNANYQISLISKHLTGISAQDATEHIYPQYWSLSG